VPIQGFTRFRKHQTGKQTVIGTPVAATRIFPYRGVLNIDPHWTDPDVDVGSIDPVLPPFRTGIEVTASLTGPLIYDDIPTMLSAGMLGGVSPTGSVAKTWTYTAASTTTTAFDYFTDEWTDDVTTDAAQAYGGIINRIQWGFGPEMGPWDTTTDWQYVNVNRPTTPTPALSVGSNVVFVYGTDTSFWINDTAGAIGTTQIVDGVHAMQQTITNTIDVKRFANGSNAVGRFGIAGFGLTQREIMTEITFAKTTDSIAETAKWLNADAQNRFIEIRNISPTVVPLTATPYSFNVKLAGRWYTRQDAEQGGNSTIVLGCKAFYDASGLTYAYRGVTVNSRSAL
jgi:hypothetical protein